MDADGWVCAACTLHNETASAACVACETRRGASSQDPSSGEESSESEDEEYAFDFGGRRSLDAALWVAGREVAAQQGAAANPRWSLSVCAASSSMRFMFDLTLHDIVSIELLGLSVRARQPL